jgi:hypothetical protein
MREIARRVGPNPIVRSAAAYRRASSHTNSNWIAPSLHRPKSNAMRHNTDTIESTTSAGKPASCITVIGLPSAGSRNNWLMASAIVSPPTLAFPNRKA